MSYQCEACDNQGELPRPSCSVCKSSEEQDACEDPVCQLNDSPMPCPHGCKVPVPASRFSELRTKLFLVVVRVTMYLQVQAPWLLIILDKCLEPFGIELGFH